MATNTVSARVPLYRDQRPTGADRVIIVAGSRGYNDRLGFHNHLLDYLRTYHLDHRVVFFSGLAKSGADDLIVRWCARYPYRVYGFPADWDKYGKRAGMLRNCEMAKHATDLLAFWDGRSPGTRHMIEEAKRRGLDVKVIVYTKPNPLNEC